MGTVYGIDLGTTYSLICKHGDEPSALLPSQVNLVTGAVGTKCIEDSDALRSFKIDMSMSKPGLLPRNASAMVLAELKHYYSDVKDVVISVPAYFSDSQRQATIESAKLAGLNVLSLINEPTAAALWITKGNHGVNVVYDLGGGTFDVSVIDGTLGMYDVIATDGCIVGGDNLDKMLFDLVVAGSGIPLHHLGKSKILSLRNKVTRLKLEIQKTQKDVTIELKEFGGGSYTLTTDTYVRCLEDVFAPTFTKTLRLWPKTQSPNLVLVGGSTRCPFLRKILEEKIGVKALPLTYDPDKAVALGAAMYAHMVEEGTQFALVSDVTKALGIRMEDGTMQKVIENNSKVPTEETVYLCNSEETDELTLDLYQGSSVMCSKNDYIGTLVYPYGRTVAPKEGAVFVTVRAEADGRIKLMCKELLCDEKSIELRRP